MMFDEQDDGMSGGEPDLAAIDLEAIQKLLDWARSKQLESKPAQEEGPPSDEPAAEMPEDPSADDGEPESFEDEAEAEEPTIISRAFINAPPPPKDEPKPFTSKSPVPRKKY